MQTVVIVIHLMLVATLIATVLLQKSEGGGLGMGSGGGGGFMSNRGAANVLTRATAILAAVFFSTSLILSILAGVERKPTSILRGSGAPSGPQVPGGEAPLNPAAPGGLLDQFRQQSEPPAQPSTPQAPRSQ